MNNEQTNIEPIYDLPLETANPFGKNVLEDLNHLLTQCIKSIPNADLENITRAFYFCVDGHKGVPRRSGEPYYTHPLKVALYLLREFSTADNAAVIASLLHDTVEDIPSIDKDLISQKFGKDVANIVDGVTKIKGTITRSMDKAATYGKLFLALVQDVRTILIKLADRFDNMKTLSFLPEDRRRAIAYETLNFYTPFAQRLGLSRIRRDMEDLSLFFIDPEAFNVVRNALEKKGKIFTDFILIFLKQVDQKLNENKIKHVITIEHKHVYEIYRMIEQGKQLKDIDNFYSIVITLSTDDFTECYRVYGIIASIFGPVSSLEDYIARPKINLYRALHSTHFGPGRKLVEVIIRTKQMDKIAVDGITSSLSFSENKKPLSLEKSEVEDWVTWMKEIIEENDDEAIQKIWGSIRMNLYEDEISVHTKDGLSYVLPKGSCLIDLAYAIDEDIAMHCISAKVNDIIHNLDYELNNNDYVEIISSPNTLPSPEWMNYVVTQKAVVGLHNYFKKMPVEDRPAILSVNNTYDVKLRISADDRPGMLHDVTREIGQINIQRINISTSNSVFEGIFTLNLPSKEAMNLLFSKLLNIKGLKGIERIEESGA